MKNLGTVISVAVLLLIMAGGTKAQSLKPFSEKGLESVLRFHLLSMKQLAEFVRERGVDFQLTPPIEKKLVAAGAYNELLEVVRASYRTREATPFSDNSYPELLDLAALALMENQMETCARLLEEAIKLEPEKAMAYQYLAFVQLYALQTVKGRKLESDRDAAEKNMRTAIEKGGEEFFAVAHNHIGFGGPCVGFFFVRKSTVAYQPVVDSLHYKDGFDVNKTDIKIDRKVADAIRMTVPHPTKPGETKRYVFVISDDFISKFYSKLISSLIVDYQ